MPVFVFQKAALECTTVGWGTCAIVGVSLAEEGVPVDPFQLIMGRSLKATFFGGDIKLQNSILK